MTTTTQTNSNQPSADHLPDAPDDVEVEAAAAAAQIENADAETEEAGFSAVPIISTRTSVMDDIVRRRREIRDGAEGRGAPQQSPEPEPQPAPAPQPAARQPLQQPQQASAPASAAPAIDLDAEITLKVDGKEIRQKLRDVVGRAQRDYSADNRLNDAKEVLREVQQLRTELRTRGAGDQPAHQPDDLEERDAPSDDRSSGTSRAHQPEDRDLDAELEDIAERIQTGDVSDGKTALKRIVDLVRRDTSAEPASIDDKVRQAIERNRHKEEVDQAFQRFSGKYQDLVDDPDVAPAVLRRAEANLRAALVEGGMPDTEVQKLSGSNQLGDAYRALKAQGRQVKSLDDILTDVGEALSQKFVPTQRRTPQPEPQLQPAPAPSQRAVPQTVSRRIEEKRGLQQQPRVAAVRAEQVPTTQRPRTYAEIVANMRRDRGYSPR